MTPRFGATITENCGSEKFTVLESVLETEMQMKRHFC